MKSVTEILSSCDHTLLRPAATWTEIQTLCREGLEYRVASVCLPPSYVRQAAGYLAGRLPVCTVLGFPNGYSHTAVKCAEAETAIADGAGELDAVANLGWVKDGLFSRVGAELLQLRRVCEGRIFKVIIETCLLTEAEKREMCRVVSDSGADFIKTSTGFSGGGATRADVALLRACVPAHIGVKAAGGIATLKDASDFLELGATRLGTSRVVALVKAMKEETDHGDAT